MANHLDLEEQEQLDQIKHFWKQYGNAFTWALIVVLGVFACWNLYQYWQRNQAVQAAALFEEMDRAVQSNDPSRIDRVLGDMKSRFGSTAYAHQSALLAAKQYVALGKTDSARQALGWLAENSSDTGYQSIAKLRLASILMYANLLDEAVAAIDGQYPASFQSLVADRRGDIFSLQGKKDQAIKQYQKAYQQMNLRSDYRRLIEVKLNALGVDVQNLTSSSTVVMQ